MAARGCGGASAGLTVEQNELVPQRNGGHQLLVARSQGRPSASRLNRIYRSPNVGGSTVPGPIPSRFAIANDPDRVSPNRPSHRGPARTVVRMKITNRGSAVASTVLVALTIVFTSACSVKVTSGAPDPSPNVLPHDQLARDISDELATKYHRQPPSIICPQDLPARVGATTRCALNASDSTVGVTATITGINGTADVKYNVQLDQSATPLPKAPAGS